MAFTASDYDAALPRWKMMRDAYAGRDAVKAEGELYLPRPAGMRRA